MNAISNNSISRNNNTNNINTNMPKLAEKCFVRVDDEAWAQERYEDGVMEESLSSHSRVIV